MSDPPLPAYAPELPPRASVAGGSGVAAVPAPASSSVLVPQIFPSAPSLPMEPSAPQMTPAESLRTPVWRNPLVSAAPTMSQSFNYQPITEEFRISDLPRPIAALASIPTTILAPLVTTSKYLYRSHLRERSPGEIAREQGLNPFYPVLIVPGFMSSGLQVVESSIKKGWVGERAWLSIQKLGFGGVHERNEEVLGRFLPSSPTPPTSSATLTPPLAQPTPPLRSQSGDLAPLLSPEPIRSSTGSSSLNDLGPTGLERTNSSLSDRSGASITSQPTNPFYRPTSPSDNVSNLSTSLPQSTSSSGPAQRAWLSHVALGPDGRSDPSHCAVRPMSGLEGVDFLQPGFLLEMGTYVFAPVIRNLIAVGYQPGQNLEAVPYDWRLCPADLEARDGYFSGMARAVERLFVSNRGKPVVLLAHSMGCKIAHYFSVWAHARKGDAWCAKYIHSAVAVGGPWLGAGKSGRGATTGDSMGVPFLKPEECVWFSRRLGSPPLMFPTCPRYWSFLTPHLASTNQASNEVSFCFVKQESFLVLNLASLTLTSTAIPAPDADFSLRYYIQIEWRGRKMRSEGKSFYSSATRTIEWAEQQRFQLPTDQFARLVPGSSQSTIRFSLLAEKFGNDTVFGRSEMDLGAALRAKTGRTEVALGEEANCVEEWDGIKLFAIVKEGQAPVVAHMSASIIMIVPGEPGQPAPSTGWSTLRPHDGYSPRPIGDMLVEDGALALYTLWEEVYKSDRLAIPGLQGAPPKGIKRWHIVYSTGRRTEVGFCVRRRFGRITKGPDGVAWNHYKLDKGPKSVPGTNGKLTCVDGIIVETPLTPQPSLAPNTTTTTSGDGTVPYISLIHPFTWRAVDPTLEVTSHHIPGAEHRAILAQQDFLRHLLDYVCARPKSGLREVKAISTREKINRWMAK